MRKEKARTLFWLLNEPLVHWARLDVSSKATPGLMAALWWTVVLGHKVVAAGPELRGSEAAGSLLGIHTVRIEKSAATLEGQDPINGLQPGYRTRL